MDVPMSTGETDWKKREKMRQEKIDAMKDSLPNNKLVQMLKGPADKKEMQDNAVEFSIIEDATWKARQAYMDGSMSMKDAMSFLSDIVESCCGDADAENKKLAKEVGA